MGKREGAGPRENPLRWAVALGEGRWQKSLPCGPPLSFLVTGLFQMRKRRNSFPTEAKGENMGEN